MDSSTAAALNDINRRFYSRYDEAFSETRSHPWPGWNRAVAPFLEQSAADHEDGALKSILDVGCGNGRFALFLDSVSDRPLRYLGVDHSPEMIRQATRRLKSVEEIDAHLQLYELVRDEPGLAIEGRPFDLVVLFGVLHHIPGFEHRRRLLDGLARQLSPTGFLILSFWQFGVHSRFERRILDWSEHNRRSAQIVDIDQLEEGDYLLAWGNQVASGNGGETDFAARRYCHFADTEEAVRLTGSLGLTTVDHFVADGNSGNLNLYFVLQAGK